MADIEKVIKALECRKKNANMSGCTMCDYFEAIDTKYHCDLQQIASDAIELLKEQQKQIETNN